ncbi:MAG: sensor domain-containing diguanylate cyclase, partial [Dehalococcoidales bacterium]|nr:sensor domain-containing diguanylate cyclase [Dehalococcoidales bacterium]
KSGVTFDQICWEVINLIPKAWKYSGIACGEIILKGKVFRTDNYQDTKWNLSSDIKMHGIKVGVIKVSYLEKCPKLDEGPFRTEERLLLDVVAERLGKAVEQQETQQIMERSEHWYHLLADNVSDVIWTATMDLKFTYFSPSVTRMRGHTVEEAMAETLDKMLTPTSYIIAMSVLEEELLIEANPHKELNRSRVLELEEYRKDGSSIWVEIKMSFLRDQSGKAVGILGVTRDITKRKLAEETIRQLAYYDTITGLPNRTLLYDRINMAIAQAERNREMLAVLVLDLDRFKDINDRFGHEVGDCLLKHVGTRITDILRKTDTAARMGGDEFVILLLSLTKVEYVSTIAEKITEAFRQPFVIDGQEVICTASIGIATYPHDGKDIDGLIKNADMAMYRAKERGRNRYEFSTKSVLGIVSK